MINKSPTVDEAFKEVNSNTPKVVQHTEAKFGVDRARKQKIAIALSKARKRGAKVPFSGLSKNSKSF